MKKSKLKHAVNKAMMIYYESGYTNTAAKVRAAIWDAIDKEYKKKHK